MMVSKSVRWLVSLLGFSVVVMFRGMVIISVSRNENMFSCRVMGRCVLMILVMGMLK